jgi:Domain of unknown function (DUF4483)
MTETKQDRYLNFLQSSGNFLLVKDSMGKPKPSTRALPDDSFTYGKKLKPDVEGVGSLLSSWAEHKVSGVPKPDKDFKKLNALSVAEGAVTAPKQRSFRKSTDIRFKSSSQRSQPYIPDMVFGLGARPSTPIKAVIGNFYGEYAADVKTSNYTPKAQKRNPTPTKSTRGFDKRYESIRNSMVPQEKGFFKLKKFLSVQPRTSTRRP